MDIISGSIICHSASGNCVRLEAKPDLSVPYISHLPSKYQFFVFSLGGTTTGLKGRKCFLKKSFIFFAAVPVPLKHILAPPICLAEETPKVFLVINP